LPQANQAPNFHQGYCNYGRHPYSGSGQLDGPSCIQRVRADAELHARPSYDYFSLTRFCPAAQKFDMYYKNHGVTDKVTHPPYLDLIPLRQRPQSLDVRHMYVTHLV
jgi:hypothetical protein